MIGTTLGPLEETVMENLEWFENRTLELESEALKTIFECENDAAVEAAVTYARFLTGVGLSPETFPVFLRVLEVENHWVIDALVGDEDPFAMLSKVQPNKMLVEHIFKMLDRWRKGGIYSKNLAMILGVLNSVYKAPHEGYRLYPVSLGELNALAKHLDKDKGQAENVNRAILDCLDRISNLESPDDPEKDKLAIQASRIRNAFFDDRRQMADVLPVILLEKGVEPNEIAPRKEGKAEDQSKTAAKKTARGR